MNCIFSISAKTIKVETDLFNTTFLREIQHTACRLGTLYRIYISGHLFLCPVYCNLMQLASGDRKSGRRCRYFYIVPQPYEPDKRRRQQKASFSLGYY